MSKKFIILALIIVIAAVGVYLYFNFQRSSARTAQVFDWFRDTSSRPELMMSAGTRCGDVPFIFPTDGLIGFIWDDSFRPAGFSIYLITDYYLPITSLTYSTTNSNPSTQPPDLHGSRFRSCTIPNFRPVYLGSSCAPRRRD